MLNWSGASWTLSLNQCPQAQWDALDPAALAQQFGTPFAFLNGPRYFIADWSSNGDALATGQALVKLIPLLQARGYCTFGDVVAQTQKHGRLLQDLNAA